MTRLTHFALPIFLAFAAPAMAQTEFVDPIVARLQAEGFAVSQIKRTLLGRTLIVATRNGTLREVVLDRRTGDILRDKLFAGQDDPSEPAAPATEASDTATDAPSGSGGNGNGKN